MLLRWKFIGGLKMYAQLPVISMHPKPDLTDFSDASGLGWGPSCIDVKTGGA